ncbi:hypothetical protein Pla52n_00200 [Stieleria varia]|uniref:Uncharacterized protein n=2 Tax=Stieleria varia TaxID=2528005 RepID=A0A5C6B6Q0_9BACT|nr:hypothetical protein Pla52n_00200 [Stieleria varia]
MAFRVSIKLFGLTTLAMSCLSFSLQAPAAEPSDYLPQANHHRLYNQALPPGAVWSSPAATQVAPAYFQPVAFNGPVGTQFDLPMAGAFGQPQSDLMAGLIVGAVYRFRITGIPGSEGAELYPTVELIGRTYPPPGLATSFPIPINLDESDMREALEGKLVTRVIYLEDPQTAAPLAEPSTSARAIDIPDYEDPMAVADRFGRPIAIVRIGSVSPPTAPELLPQFMFGSPPYAPIFKPQPQSN